MTSHLDRKHQYKKNYLTDVFLRVDFEKIDYAFDKIEKIKKTFSDNFPILQKVETKNIIFSIKDNAPRTEESKSIIYKLVDNDIKNSKVIEFGETYFAYTEKEYYSHASFEEIALKIVNFFKENFESVSLTRIGLRYINQIYLKEKNPYELDQYINSKLVSILKVNPQEKPILRSMNSTEYKIDEDTRLIFKYGLFNKNYPAEPINKEFVLDFDCYSNIVDKLENVKAFMDKNNQLMAIYFENSIEENLRKELDETKTA